jgi:hypothetical protein
MAKSKTKCKRTPKHVLKLPDLEQSKSAVLNSLTSQSSQRTYDHAIREFIEWYCSEPSVLSLKFLYKSVRLSRGFGLLFCARRRALDRCYGGG